MTIAAHFTRFNISYAALSMAIIALPFSIKLCHAGIISFLLAWVTETTWRMKISVFRESLLIILITGFFALNLIGVLYSDNKESGWFGIEKKIFLFLIPLALATTNQKFSKQQIESLFVLFVIACFAGSVTCLIHAVAFQGNDAVFNDYLRTTSFTALNPQATKSWMQFSYVSIADGIGIHPTFFALYLAFCIIFIYYLLRTATLTRRARILLWILSVYFSLFLICLASRIVIFSLGFIVLLFITREFFYSPDKTHGIIVAMLAIIFTIVLYINPVARYRSVQEVASTPFEISAGKVQSNSIQIRLSLWWLAVKSVNVANFVAGTGTGDVTDTMKTSARKYGIRNVLDSHDPHNQFLFTLLANGFIGLIVLILNFAIPAYYNWIQRDYLYLTFGFLCCSVCLTESALELQKGVVFFALIGSLLLLRVKAFENFTVTGIKFKNAKL